MKKVLKVLAAVAAIAGVVYAIAAYGDKIVAMCKKLRNWFCPCKKSDVIVDTDFTPDTEEAPTEDSKTEPEDVPVADETVPVADEDDFES